MAKEIKYNIEARDLLKNEWGRDQLDEGMWETVNPEGAEALITRQKKGLSQNDLKRSY